MLHSPPLVPAFAVVCRRQCQCLNWWLHTARLSDEIWHWQMSALKPWDVLLTVRAKNLVGITVFLYVLLGAVFCNQLCLFLVFLPNSISFKFWSIYVRSWREGPPPQAVCTCAGQLETRLAQIKYPSSGGRGLLQLSWKVFIWSPLARRLLSVTGFCRFVKERKQCDKELYVFWVDEGPDVSLPFGTPSPWVPHWAL